MSSSQSEYYSFKITKTKAINVLFVGRSGTGKTTLVESLSDQNFQVTSTSGYSDTKVASCYQCILHGATNKTLYQLNMLDTPGLQEHRIDPKQNRSDDTLLNLSMRCIENSVTFLNVVCFVTKAGETYEHDVAVFQKLKNFLGEKYSPNSMIILTHAEQLPPERIDQYIKDIQTHPVTKPLVEYCRLGIFSTGTINTDHLVGLPDDLKNSFLDIQQKKIAPMRNKLISTIIKCADIPVKITELEEFQKKIEAEKNRICKEGVAEYERKNSGGCNIM